MRALLVDCCPYMEPVAPTALAGMGAALRREEYDVGVMSLGSSTPVSVAGLAARLGEQAPDLLGFSLYQRNVFTVRAFARLAKEYLPAVTVVVGGPQATFLPEEGVAAMSEVDVVVRGEGEMVIAEVGRRLAAGEPLAPLPGATVRGPDGCWVSSATEPPADDLDCYPSPWLEGVLDPRDWDDAVLLTSRGCASSCVFCITPPASGWRVRQHSLERVLAELEWVVRRGSGRVWFADPNLSTDRERLVALLDGVLGRGLTPAMWMEVRADLLTAELAALMRRAGVHTVAMGLESAAPGVVARLGKGLGFEEVGRATRLALAAGIDVELFSQFALPGETVEDALATLRFVQSCGVRVRGNSNAQQMQLYFGSKINERPQAFGIRPLTLERPPYLAAGTEFETEWMSRGEMTRVRAAWLATSEDGGKRVVS